MQEETSLYNRIIPKVPVGLQDFTAEMEMVETDRWIAEDRRPLAA